MSDKYKKAHGEVVGYSTYLQALLTPWFSTGEYAMKPWKGKVELKIVNNMTLAVYVDNEEDFDLACAVLDETFSKEKKDVEVRFFDKVNILKN